MKFVIVILFVTFSIQPLPSKNLSAHVHGKVRLDLATEGRQLLVLLKSPSESFLGFEYKAKSENEKKLVLKVKKEWNESLLSYFGSNSLKDCKITSSQWQQRFEGESHSNIEAEAYINCEHRLAGRTLKVELKEKHKDIKVIHLQLLKEDGTVLNKEISDGFKIKR